ncbi:MAG: flagellar biosynthetic protein FlhB [Planctomycetota bacterium]|jgi:flagellar biosynthetic protein FlhB
MGIFKDDQGKTEQPTPGKLAEVRNKGDSPLSKELVQGGVLFIAAIMLMWIGEWLLDSLSTVLRTGLTVKLDGRNLTEVGGVCAELWRALMTVLPPFVTLLLVLLGATMLIGYGQIGLKFSRQTLKLKPEKLNPFVNFNKVFNPQALMRAVFAVFKLSVIGSVLYFVLADRIPVLLHLHEQEFSTAAREIGDLVLSLVLWISAIVTIIAAADIAYQRYDFNKRNMMTKTEVDDERKRSDGDPTMKARQKGARNELLQQRMMQEVPRADVILTNPTHYSVALRYDRSKDSAPTVVAKGVDDMAMRIREIARENDVPLMEDPPLTRALYRAVKVGQTVPEKFYQAVATVLSHVYRLNGRSA